MAVLLQDTSVGAPVQAPPPIVGELQSLFEAIDDSPLMDALNKPRRGPKGHSVRVLFRCMVTKHYMGLKSTDALIRMLRNNPWVAQACGIDSPADIPHKSTFSRFIGKISKYRTMARLKDVSREIVRRQYRELPGFGQRVAMDSTTLKGWTNGGKTIYSDSDAGWSVKNNTHGRNEYVLGYKLHLMVDMEHELPIAANISAGNVNDSMRASNLLSESRFTTRQNPKFVAADPAYFGRKLDLLIKQQYGATPIILANKSHKRRAAKEAKFQATPEFKALYRQRQSVERAFSRLKGQRSLNHITTRGLRKVTAHCYLALIAMQAEYLIRM